MKLKVNLIWSKRSANAHAFDFWNSYNDCIESGTDELNPTYIDPHKNVRPVVNKALIKGNKKVDLFQKRFDGQFTFEIFI